MTSLGMAISLPPDNPLLLNLEDVFCCYICLGRLHDTRLCPKCSKMCCFQCIRRWLIEQKPSCPHCRSSLLLHELVKCRWVDDLLPRLESQSRKEALSKDQCATHSEQLSVYCVTCGVCVCHQCALWAGEHSKHKFQPVTEIYDEHKKELYGEVKNLKKRLAEILDCVSDIDRQLSSYNHERDTQLKQMNKVMKDITSRIDIQISSQIAKLRHQQSTLQKDSDIVEQKIGDVLNKIETSVKSELIRSFPELLQELLGMSVQLAKPPTANLTYLGKELQFTNELVPPYLAQEFFIEEFSSCRRRGTPIYSPPLSLHGQVWKLKVYPDGNGVFRGDFLSVFLELNQGFSGSSKYEYRVSMEHSSVNSERTVYREFSSDFEPGECWGYNRFYRLEHLETKGYIDSVDDSLTLYFAVRSPTFYHDSLQQRKHVSSLREQLEGMRACVRESELRGPPGVVLVLNSDDEEGAEAKSEDSAAESNIASEELDRAFLLRFDEGPAVPEAVLPSGIEGDNLYELVVSDTEIPGLSGDSQESVGDPLASLVLEGASDHSMDLECTLVSASDQTAASNLLFSYSSREHNDSPVSVGSEGLSIHSIDSPPHGPEWSPPALSELFQESSSEERDQQLAGIMSNLSDIQAATAEQAPIQDSYLEATRFTDSLPTNFPNIQASILACLREVSNNPLIGHVPVAQLPDTSTSPNPWEILPLPPDSSTSDSEEEPLGSSNMWIEEREAQLPADEQHIPE